jgi:YegS/Rv2252/BmrU family lipid kinase
VASQTLIIVNRHAAKARRSWPAIKSSLVQNGLRFDVHETSHAGDAETKTRESLQHGYQTIVALGGDGTLSECAAGFFEQTATNPPARINPAAALAVLPSGTGNDFARGLSGVKPLAHWTQRLLQHERGNNKTSRMIDVLRGSTNDGAHHFIALNAATLGIGAEVAQRVAAQKNMLRIFPGEARFAFAALASLAFWREKRVRVTIDAHDAFEASSNLIAVSNGLYAGGGMMFTPEARNDDGYLDLLVVRDGTRHMIAREMTRIHRGGHVGNSRVRIMRGESVRIEPLSNEPLAVEADGNLRGHIPATFTVMPQALRVVV